MENVCFMKNINVVNVKKIFLKDSFKLEIMIFIYCTLYIFV